MKFEKFMKGIQLKAIIALFALLLSGTALAKLNSDEMARLGISGTELTPMGAIRAGNAEGTIPEWNSKPIKGVEGGTVENLGDPFADEKPLFVITADNYTKHQDKLTVGQVALFKQYPETFKMQVYPTHRTGSYDDWVYNATLKQAENIEVCDENATTGQVCLKNEISGGGIPFPIPKTGEEAIWNHYLAFRFVSYNAMTNEVLVDTYGNRTDVISVRSTTSPWWAKASSKLKQAEYLNLDGGATFCESMVIKSPPRAAGLAFGACMYAKDISTHAYLYVPGQRRVRKAPEIGFHDSQTFGSDGMSTAAERWMGWFGGSFPRHNFSKPVLKEVYVPYNNNKLTNADLTFDEMFKEEHLNQDLVRYELHRVWVIEGTLKEGKRHLYKRQTMYFDEDTWVGLAFEAYDGKDRLWRVGEQYNVFYYGQNVTSPTGDIHIDLLNGRYATYPYWQHQTGKIKGHKPVIVSDGDAELGYNPSIFTPQGMRKFGRR